MCELGCDKCDKGIIRIPKVDGSIGWTSRYCDCYYDFENMKLMYELWEESGLPLMDMIKNPVSLVDQKYLDVIEASLSEEERYGGKNWLYIWGSPGTGKTLLSTAAAQMAIEKENSVFFMVVAKFLDAMRPDSKQVGVMEKAEKVHLLILDDWGKEKCSEWVLEKLFILINDRYSSGLPTIITSNLDPTTDFGEDSTSKAIIERVLQYSTLIPLRVGNRRVQKNN